MRIANIDLTVAGTGSNVQYNFVVEEPKAAGGGGDVRGERGGERRSRPPLSRAPKPLAPTLSNMSSTSNTSSNSSVSAYGSSGSAFGATSARAYGEFPGGFPEIQPEVHPSSASSTPRGNGTPRGILRSPSAEGPHPYSNGASNNSSLPASQSLSLPVASLQMPNLAKVPAADPAIMKYFSFVEEDLEQEDLSASSMGGKRGGGPSASRRRYEGSVGGGFQGVKHDGSLKGIFEAGMGMGGGRLEGEGSSGGGRGRYDGEGSGRGGSRYEGSMGRGRYEGSIGHLEEGLGLGLGLGGGMPRTGSAGKASGMVTGKVADPGAAMRRCQTAGSKLEQAVDRLASPTESLSRAAGELQTQNSRGATQEGLPWREPPELLVKLSSAGGSLSSQFTADELTPSPGSELSLSLPRGLGGEGEGGESPPWRKPQASRLAGSCDELLPTNSLGGSGSGSGKRRGRAILKAIFR